MRLPTPDEQVRYFIVLALADAEYLQAISSHYGRSNCLDAAIQCLAARIQDLLMDTKSTVNTIQLYSRSLHVLQKAITENAFSERFEIYYAIPLLVLFELLNPLDRLAFLTYGRGAVHFLHFIGPRGMTSELDKTLLAMQSDVMIVENLRDGNTHCCAKSEWQDALRQTIKVNLPAGALRSEPSITLNIIATSLPDAFTQVEMAVEKSQTSLDLEFVHRLLLIQDSLQDWSDRWSPTLREVPRSSSYSSIRQVLLAIYLMYTAISHRLIAAIPASLGRRLKSELNALQAAHSALDIVNTASSHDIIGQARLALVSKFVRSIIDTSSAWQLAITRHGSLDQPVDKALFKCWCLQIGRETLQKC